MTDPIRAALDKAAEAICPTGRATCGPCAPLCSHCLNIASNVIAAFNYRLHSNGLTAIAEGNLPWLAEAVLAAAKDQANE
jgi:hypothetical protein